MRIRNGHLWEEHLSFFEDTIDGRTEGYDQEQLAANVSM